MYWFLVPMAIGFACNWASAFTGFLCERLGAVRGRRAGFALRNILGIPVWAAGVALAFSRQAGLLYVPGPGLTALSWLLLLLGTASMLLGIRGLGVRAYRPTTRDTLVSDGVFRHIRHPIYSGLLVDFAALALQRPTRPVLLACVLGWLFTHVQARLEEIDLRRRVPGYGAYMEAVPRFLPRLWRS